MLKSLPSTCPAVDILIYFDTRPKLTHAVNVRIRWPLLLLHEGHFVQEFSFWFKQADVKSLAMMLRTCSNVNVILPCADLSSSRDDSATARYCSNKQESSTTGANRPFNEDMVNAINNEKIEQLTPHSTATAGIDS
ncbi:hypothetical protein T06_14291 [Trichinella sp. T6]|nr:hypothetical protein T06_14291 [Trichinella sp. T6]